MAIDVSLQSVIIGKPGTPGFVEVSETQLASMNPSDYYGKSLMVVYSAGIAPIPVRSNGINWLKFKDDSVFVPAGANVPVASVSITPSSLNLVVGGTQQLTANVLPSNATNKAVSWASSDASKATVSASGLVTALAPGTVNISAVTADGGYSSLASVTVTAAVVIPTSVVVTPNPVSLFIGGTQQMVATVLPANSTNKAVTWSSSDTAKATVSGTGLVTAISAGSVNIIAITANGLSSSSTLTASVDPSIPVSVSVSPNNFSLAVGATQQMVSSVSPSTASQAVTWSSTDTSKATVSSSGLVTSLAAGSVNIRATTANGLFYDSALTVTSGGAVTSVSIAPKTASLSQTSSQQLTATVIPSSAANKSVTYTADTSVGIVDSTGSVKPFTAGALAVAVKTADGGFTDTALLTVTGPVATPPPAIDINTVVFTGASLEQYMVNGGYQATPTAGYAIASMQRYFLAKHGLNISIANVAVEGDTLTQSRARYNAAKSAWTGNAKVLVWMQNLGNNVTNNAWGTLTTTQQNAVITEFNAFVDEVVANGNVPMLVNHTFRNYDSTTVTNEARGSKPYNDNVVLPKAQALGAGQLFNGKVFADLYDWTRRYYSGLFQDPAKFPQHPDYTSESNQSYMVMDIIAARIKGLAPPVYERIEDPTGLPQTYPQTFGIVTASNGPMAYRGIMTNQMSYGVGSTDYGAIRAPTTGYVPGGLKVKFPIASAAFGTNDANTDTANTGDTTETLTNDLFRKRYFFVLSATEIEFCRISGGVPGATVDIEWFGLRTGTAGQTGRKGSVRFNGGSWIAYDANTLAGVTPTLRKVTATFDANGEVIWTAKSDSASDYTIINAFSIRGR